MSTVRAPGARRLLDLLRATVRIPSHSGNERRLGAYMAERLRALGLRVSRQRVRRGRYNIAGVWPGRCRDRGRSLLLNGHLDTNPVGLGWTRDPFGGEIDEEFIYGAGVSNMKASNACYLHAVETLRDAGFEPEGDVTLAYVVGELEGGIGTRRLIAGGVRAAGFIVGEPTDLAVLTRHAGSFVFEIHTLGRTRHLSKAEEGVDAIRNMAALLPRLRALRFSGNGHGPALSRVHVGAIRGGLSRSASDARPAQVADFCAIKGSARFGPGQNLESASADFQALLAGLRRDVPGFSADWMVPDEGRAYMPPFSADPRSRLVRRLARAHREVTGRRPKVGAIAPYMFYNSDAAHLAAAGLPGVLYGPGGKFNTMPDERVAIADLVTAAQVYARAIVSLTSAGPSKAKGVQERRSIPEGSSRLHV